jgi:uncharacterized OB-fold protein
MSDEVAKPLPTITDENREFWDGARAGVLRLQRCAQCGHVRNPVQALCPRCLSDEFTWTDLSGRGSVFSKVVYHRAFHPAYRGDVPYNVVIVQLEEGPRMFSNVVDHNDFEVGDPVEVVFDHVTDEVTVPRFRLVEPDSQPESQPNGESA